MPVLPWLSSPLVSGQAQALSMVPAVVLLQLLSSPHSTSLAPLRAPPLPVWLASLLVRLLV